MARLASLEYLRTFWWVAAGVPAGGLLFVIVGRGVMQVIGFFALMWPFSIPARAVLVTSSMAQLFVGGVKMAMLPDRLELQGQTPGRSGRRLRMTLPRDEIRDIARRGDVLLVRTIMFGFVPIARSAFASESEEERFIAEAAIVEPVTSPNEGDPSSRE